MRISACSETFVISGQRYIRWKFLQCYRDPCLFAIDSDAHAPGQLDWLANGTVRAEQAGITADRVINARGAGELAGS